jgi:hypothetical protein
MFERVRAEIAKRISPYSEAGVGGAVVYGGYLQSPPGAVYKPELSGSLRWRKATHLLADVSIIAASLRFTLNLMARPSWKAEPPSDKPEAKAAAEFAESILHGTDTSWSRIVRRSGTYRYHGFGFHEWTAIRRDDGMIGIKSIEPRPQHTIARWERDANGSVTGVWQRNPQNGQEIFLPREKVVYLVDDMLTDSPEGLGWYRHLIDPANALLRYLKLEKSGFNRDLVGIPVGRAPISAINALIGKKMIPDGKGGERLFTKADAEEMIRGIAEFVSLKAKEPDTGITLDSQPFTGKTADGTTVSTALQWGLELLTGTPTSIDALGKAIGRLTWDMALIMGTQSLLIGREGAGSLALSADASRNLALNINSATGDMAEAYDRDLIGPAWALNGLDPALRPKLRVEDAAFKDIEQIAKMLADMSSAGAIMAPDDPAIDDLRDLAGISRQPEMTPERMGMLMGTPDDATTPGDPNDDPNADPAKKPKGK